MGAGDGAGHRGWNWHWVQPPKDYQTMIVPVNSLFNYEYWKLYWQQVVVVVVVVVVGVVVVVVVVVPDHDRPLFRLTC